MKETIQKITCDICGRAINSDDYYEYIHKKEVCKDCLKKISDIIDAACYTYGVYAYGGDFIKWRDKEKEKENDQKTDT